MSRGREVSWEVDDELVRGGPGMDVAGSLGGLEGSFGAWEAGERCESSWAE